MLAASPLMVAIRPTPLFTEVGKTAHRLRRPEPVAILDRSRAPALP